MCVCVYVCLCVCVCVLVCVCVCMCMIFLCFWTHFLELTATVPQKNTVFYKIACLCFQCIYQNSMPPYISDLLHPYCPSRTLCSLDTSLLTVPRFSLETFGKRSFSVFGPTVWNSLPLSLRKTQCFTTFKTKLKTHLFRTHLC